MLDEVLLHCVAHCNDLVGILRHSALQVRHDLRAVASTSTPFCAVDVKNYRDFRLVFDDQASDAAEPVVNTYNVKLVAFFFYESVYEFCSTEYVVDKYVVE